MKEFLGTKKNSYRKITDIEREGDERFYDLTRKKDEYWTLDHNTMKYFEEIEEIAKPTEWGDLDRLLEGFLYHSQYQEYGHQCYELVRDKLGEELDELFSVWAQPEVIELINQVGDIDNPIPLGIKMLKDIPEFRRLATKGASALIWG